MKSWSHYRQTALFWLRVWRHGAADRFWTFLERVLPQSSMRRECPCCGWNGLQFRAVVFGEYSRTCVRCPRCSSYERHRSLALFYPQFFSELPFRPARVIHFAAEPCLAAVVVGLCGCYERSSFDGQDADLRLDLTRMDLSDVSCDVMLMNQVLDCMHNDRAAVSEMHRVLCDNGVVLATVSLQSGNTVEFPMTSTGQTRVYGLRDIEERFAPFSVSLINPVERLPTRSRERFGIRGDIQLLVLRKGRGAVA